MSLKRNGPTPVKVIEPGAPIAVIGCGGTGGFVVKNICRQLYGLKHRDGHAGHVFHSRHPDIPPMTLIDGDMVEPKNALRQDFMPADAGRAKALALAERYAGAYALDVRAYPHYLTTETDLDTLIPDGSIVVGCVDNSPTRALLHDALSQYENIVYLDSGNGGVSPVDDPEDYSASLRADRSGWSGQVVCGVNHAGRRVLPFPAEVMPDLIEIEPDDPHPAEIPCRVAIASQPQRQMTNLLAATVLMQYLTPLIHDAAVLHSSGFFDARRGYVRNNAAVEEIAELTL